MIRRNISVSALTVVLLIFIGTSGAAQGTQSSSRTALARTLPTIPIAVIDVCNIEFQLADQVTLGSLQFDVDYETASGEFLGSGPDVGNGGTLECYSELPGALGAFTDQDAERLLTAGIVLRSGFTGPVTVASCVFVPDAGADVAPQNFVVTVTDAKDPNVQPIEPFPAVVVSSIDCTDCGNGTLNAGEDCDDGNSVGYDGCSPSCTIEDGWQCSPDEPICIELCGDGILVGAEGCDDGNTINGDGCSARCVLEPGWDCTEPPSVCDERCGDGRVVGVEQCDEGDAAWTLGEACGADCKWLGCCDVDASGKVTSGDALAVLLKATQPERTCDRCVCDSARTAGTIPITAVDALACLRTAVNIPTALACPACSVEVVINEVSFMPSSGSEFVELLNAGSRSTDITRFDVANAKGATYTIPTTLPPVPPGAFVVIRFDGNGPAGDDVNFADNKAVLHTSGTALRGNVFDDAQDSVLLFSSSDHSGASLVDSVSWGEVAALDNQVPVSSLRPDSSVPMQAGDALAREPYLRDALRHWAIYRADESSPGAPNPVNQPHWFTPRNGSSTSERRPVLAWQHSGVDIVGYDLECDDDAAFASPLIDTTVFIQRFNVATDLPIGTVHCRVRAVNSASMASTFETISFQVVAATSVASAGRAANSKDLGVLQLQQRKDTRLVCLHEYASPHTQLGSTGDHPWDAPHKTRGCPHDNEYCCRAAVAMVAAYFGGSLSQDRISYECYDGSMLKGENDDLRHGVGMWPTCASTSTPALNVMEWALNVAPNTINGVQNPAHSVLSACPDCTNGPRPTFSQVKGFIDAGRPIIWVTDVPFHCHVVDGYTDPDGNVGTADDQIHVIDPWTGDERLERINNFDFGPRAAYFVAPSAASPRSDEADVWQDPDFDGLPRFTGSYEARTYNTWGLMTFDETNRFSTNATDFDSDNDCIDDKVEVWSYTFVEPRTANQDSDPMRAEVDSDSDNKGVCDGDDRQEDRNKDGDVDANETDPFKSDETLSGCQCTPLGGGAADLVAEMASPTVGYCKLVNAKLRVTIRNQGGGAAGASLTKVTFSPGGAVELATPAVAAHAAVTVDFTIPSACWNSDCDFTIQVDSGGQVAETDEGNNSVSGVCAG